MQQELPYYKTLLAEFITGTASKEEVAELIDFINYYPAEYKDIADSPEILALMITQSENENIIVSDAAGNRMRQGLFERVKKESNVVALKSIPTKVLPLWKRIAAASVILIIISIAAYFIFNKKENIQVAKNITHDIAAPGSKATITLADGRKIAIDSLNAGTIAMQGNTKVVKNANGEITYQSTTNEQGSTIQYNTLYNPRGSNAKSLTLSDGTQVWLNAESSLKFPTAFTGMERKVVITGEAYFEVAHNTAMPFKVSKGNAEVTVLGTHFNVNAYDDEDAIKVTLLEGSVKFAASNQSTIIKPGQQAILYNNQLTTNNDIDVNAVLAWQRGQFEFNNAELPVIMRQISRWYDVDVIYDGTTGHEKFGGGISNKLPLSNVLKLLEASGVKFTLEGRTLKVNKK